MLEEQLKNKIAVKYFKKFDCTNIIKRIDFSVKNDYGYLLWAEAKQQPTDIYRMLAQLLITIKADAWNLTPPKFLGCFDNEKICFVPYYDVQPVFALNDFNWTQTPSQVDDKTVQTVKNIIDNKNIFTFRYGDDDENIKNFIAKNFNEFFDNIYLATLIDKNNFIFVYQKWLQKVRPYINADFEKLKKSYAVYDRDFFLAELNIDDNGTTDISDDKTVNEDFYITFNANSKRPYQLLKRDGLGMEILMPFGFKNDGLKHYAEFWKLYKRPPKDEIWKYIISRLDLLVPQDVRERKGAFFTPQIWVEKSQQYIADVLGENWQDEYYVWDCCAGTGNLLNGLTNKYRIFASTLDQQDVDVMKERIKNGANLLESHVFQFDFLNDDFNSDKMPEDLKKIITDDEKRTKLVIYINPPYAEHGNAKLRVGTAQNNKASVATETQIYKKYNEKIGTAAREIFAQFLIRIYLELQRCKIANFATLKALCASNFASFRNIYQARLEKIFLVPADTFDNVKGQFPISFQVWNCDNQEIFNEIQAEVYDILGNCIGEKTISSYYSTKYVIFWLKQFHDKNNPNFIGYLRMCGTDMQHNKDIFVCNQLSNNDIKERLFTPITVNNLIHTSIYNTIRHVITADWLNDRDQFLFPNDGWENDYEFHSNCLVWTLFNNNIQSKFGVNHWIPFAEEEVNAKSLFDSHFMKDFLDGKIKPQKANDDLFSETSNDNSDSRLQFTAVAQSVLNAGRELWRYYHTMEDANPNASLYDIKEYFQGRNEKGKMNSTSNDTVYTSLLSELKNSLRLLGEEIKPKVYEYGFLR